MTETIVDTNLLGLTAQIAALLAIGVKFRHGSTTPVPRCCRTLSAGDQRYRALSLFR
jgi:hypothetical protein